ncbi:MAG: MarR family winged helix-turn-helix transcriptional regulator [Jannaschia sp.]
MSDALTPLYFRFFNEIGIINQLATAVLESRLPDGLLAPHFTVLNHLVRVKDGRTPLEMATAFQIPKTTMTHQIRVLERHGLVGLAPNPEDGRSKRVWLTEAGRTLREGIIHGFADVVQDWSKLIDPEEVADLLPRLERIRIHLDQARNAD